MAKTDKPLTAKSSIGEWLKHPVGAPLIRDLLAGGGQTELALRPVRMLALQKLVSLSQGQMPQSVIDDLVLRANGGEAPSEDAEEEAGDLAAPVNLPSKLRGEVVVVIGVGGMGELIARRQGTGKRLLIADFSQDALDRVRTALRGDGYDVTDRKVDVSSRESMAALAAEAAALGPVFQVIHTAGLSPVQASAAAITAVDLVGVANMLEEFAAVVEAGGAGLVISSMAGYGIDLTQQDEEALANDDPASLAQLPFISALTDPGAAYGYAKRGNILRVEAASVAWGRRGARVNSISPGVIATPLGQQELNGEHGDVMRAMIESSGAGRLGTPNDIADAAAFLLGPTASFITGTDLLVDGGVVGARSAS
ncbi:MULTISPECIES: SDR family oxidoreductase [unclassified Cryobacterium]|uniref:SDR family oxidoreductase n=1 Tax=unclassified Cryobacterium TaxID=2649013 RepID=UPI001F53F2D4|nr:MULTISPECIES: SDR family oxidoreductase [unclassified Cryobacterium]MDY7529488.1 SDR family oxidoreductase [Cryobacterium sp. 10C2]MDY7558369.1 SDR family oxidoreductase [Cryobacterium sp. 10C3]MEB0203341.1 SDR family oxidoreductase [Cryobacterium sp. 5I3]MEB0291530.1 SDR family oxidoreductase [Cryobacterium sp. 10C2]